MADPVCTGVAASWCPRCGDCACPRDEEGWLADTTGMNHPDCPLHAPGSKHAEAGWLILCHEHGDGAVCLWWRPNGAGYSLPEAAAAVLLRWKAGAR